MTTPASHLSVWFRGPRILHVQVRAQDSRHPSLQGGDVLKLKGCWTTSLESEIPGMPARARRVAHRDLFIESMEGS